MCTYTPSWGDRDGTCLSEPRHLLHRENARVGSLGPKWKKEINDSHKLSFDTHTCAMAHACSFPVIRDTYKQ